MIDSQPGDTAGDGEVTPMIVQGLVAWIALSVLVGLTLGQLESRVKRTRE
jgi:hypothetical protein